MNLGIAANAILGLYDSHYDSRVNDCQIFVREVYESIYGPLFESVRARTASEVASNWKSQTPTDVKIISHASQLEPGDLLYKNHHTDPPSGHAAVYIGSVGSTGYDVTENSAFANHRVHGAKGYRTLSEFGDIDVIVRLPSLDAKVEHGGMNIARAGRLTAATFWAQASDFASAFAVPVSWDTTRNILILNHKEIHTAKLVANKAFAPVNALAFAVGYPALSFDAANHTILLH